MAEADIRCANVASLTVRPVRCEERARWRQLMNAHHYLGFRPIVGQSLWYVATCGGAVGGAAGLGGRRPEVRSAGRLDWLDTVP